MDYSVASKGGTARTGANRDKGRILHIIPGKETHGYWGTPAVCGAKPGKKGYGWAGVIKEYQTLESATCPKCRKILGLG